MVNWNFGIWKWWKKNQQHTLEIENQKRVGLKKYIFFYKASKREVFIIILFNYALSFNIQKREINILKWKWVSHDDLDFHRYF